MGNKLKYTCLERVYFGAEEEVLVPSTVHKNRDDVVVLSLVNSTATFEEAIQGANSGNDCLIVFRTEDSGLYCILDFLKGSCVFKKRNKNVSRKDLATEQGIYWKAIEIHENAINNQFIYRCVMVYEFKDSKLQKKSMGVCFLRDLEDFVSDLWHGNDLIINWGGRLFNYDGKRLCEM